jgi:hypothetical protein
MHLCTCSRSRTHAHICIHTSTTASNTHTNTHILKAVNPLFTGHRRRGCQIKAAPHTSLIQRGLVKCGRPILVEVIQSYNWLGIPLYLSLTHTQGHVERLWYFQLSPIATSPLSIQQVSQVSPRSDTTDKLCELIKVNICKLFDYCCSGDRLQTVWGKRGKL